MPIFSTTVVPQWSWEMILVALAVVLLAATIRHYWKHQQGLLDQIEQTNLLLDSTAEGIYALDLEGNCIFCNSACLTLLGYDDTSELLGKNLHELIHHSRADASLYPAEACKVCHAYTHDQKVHFENEVFWRRDGSPFPTEYWSFPLRRGETVIGAVVSFLDITERKRAEQKLRAINQELDAFAHTISHDLRTPITGVIGYAELLLENHGQALNDEGRKYLETISRQGEKMAMIMEDLLELATVGHIELPLAAVNVDNLLSEVLLTLSDEISRSALDVEVTPLPWIRVPQTQLIQVFENLLGNALRYAGPQAGPIEVSGSRQGDKVSYLISDHGQGIPESERARIFEAFYRGSSGKARQGSGIGLATVQKICGLYGGQVLVEETPGGGATFRVELHDPPPSSPHEEP
ncbi:MAG: hypothetical protein C0624_04965 [Desulfuromonas sp.]|nr:MAG: hypothetical protein C0624_04965 [Desulfuromonas sp.]